MKLPGTLAERLAVILAERRRLLRATEVAELEDAGVRVDFELDGATSCIWLRLDPQDIQFLRGGKCPDFALLLACDEDVFEAHVVELKSSVDERDWARIQEQHEWAAVRLLAIAGVLGVQIHGVTVYTAFCNDRLSREGSPNPAAMKVPLDTDSEGKARRRAEARHSWESGRLRMAVFQRDVEHRRIRASEGGRAAVACRARPSPGEDDTRWIFEPVAG